MLVITMIDGQLALVERRPAGSSQIGVVLAWLDQELTVEALRGLVELLLIECAPAAAAPPVRLVPGRPLPAVCPRCHQPYRTHRRCATCEIGLGEGHVEGPGVRLNGQDYCGEHAARVLGHRRRVA